MAGRLLKDGNTLLTQRTIFLFMETPKAKPRNGWPVWLDGETIKILRDIQQNATQGSPSYASIVRGWAQSTIAAKRKEP